MADLDAEILALAGGDESSDEGSPMPIKEKSPSPARSPSHSREPDRAEVPRKVTARTTTKKARRTKRDESEEGEASSASSRHSLQSASMSESESEAGSSPAAEDGVLFPYEKLYYSAKDKAEIMAKPEIQREEILADRAAQAERAVQDITLRRLLAAKKREESKLKRKAGSADLEDNQRKSSRQKTALGGRRVGEKSSTIEAYKRQREEKNLRDQARRDAAARNKDRKAQGSPDEAYSDADAEGEEDGDLWDTTRRSPSPPKDEPSAELVDIQRILIGRNNFAQVCFYPGFEKAITNCFARVCVGPGQGGVNQYRVCVIKGFAQGKPYAMEAPNGRPFVTDQYIDATHGKATRAWPFIACSNSRITEDEWRRYRVTLANEDGKLPTRKQAVAKVDDINRLINHSFTQEEINEKIRRQEALGSKIQENQRKEIEEIQARRQEAINAGDESAIARCDAELAAIKGPKLAFGTSIERAKVSSTHAEQQDRLAELNRRNQRLNAENVRKAELAEMRARRRNEAAVASGSGVEDPFARVKTRAKVHHDVNEKKNHLKVPGAEVDDLFEGSDRSRAGTPMSGTNTPRRIGTPRRSGTPLNGLKKELPRNEKGIPMIRRSRLEEERAEALALDLGIDIEL